MAMYAEGVTVLLIAALHIVLVLWMGRNILKSKFSWSEKAVWLLVCIAIPLLGPGIYAAYAKNYLTKAELLDLVLAILLLGFMFSFRLWGTDEFSISIGINNWLRMCGLGLITIGVHVMAQKGMARRVDCMVRWQLWRLASLLALCLIFITNGIFVWCAIGWVAVESWVYMRPGRRTIEQILGPWEKAKIVAAGPFASVGLAALAKIMGGYFAKDLWHQLMIMNIWFAIFSVLPLMVGKVIWSTWWSKFFTSKKKYKGTLHVMLRNILQRAGAYKPIGEHLFFGGRVLWIFMFVFVVVSCLLFLIMSILASVLIAASLAVILMAVWHFKLEPQKYRKW